MTPHEFLTSLMIYCSRTRASVTSYGRTTAHNLAVHGVASSPHLAWLGADVVYDDPLPREHKKDYADRLGFLLIEEGDHDHLQPLDWKAG